MDNELVRQCRVDARADRSLVSRRAVGGDAIDMENFIRNAAGMRLSMTFTTPPMADDPNRSDEGPRKTSILSAVSGLMTTAWSTLVLDTSKLPIPSARTRMRSP